MSTSLALERPRDEWFDVIAYDELLDIAESKGLPLVVPRTSQAVRRLLNLVSPVGSGLTRQGPRLNTHIVASPEKSTSEMRVSVAQEARELAARIQQEAVPRLERVDRAREGLYFPLPTEHGFHDLMEEKGVYFFTGLRGRTSWEPLAAVYLDRSQALLKTMRETLQALVPGFGVRVPKMAELGGFLLKPEAGLPKGITREILLASLMLELQRYARSTALELLVCAVNDRNPKMDRMIKKVGRLSPGVVTTFPGLHCPKDQTPSAWHTFDLVGQHEPILKKGLET